MKKLSALLLTLLAGVAGSANAYEDFQGTSATYPQTPWLRGTVNNWAKSALVAAVYSKSSHVEYVGYINFLGGQQQFKIDTSAKADWSTNYGDNNLTNGCLDANGANIPVTQGAGTYEVRYYSWGSTVNCNSPYLKLTKLNTFVANLRSLYLRTSFNNWGPLPMILVKNNVWEGYITAPRNTSGYMKFDTYGDWSSSFGRGYGTDIRSNTNNGYALTRNGDDLGLYVEDYSGAATVTAKIRFNDATNEFALCRDASRPICQ